MIVSELIEILNGFDQNMSVVGFDERGYHLMQKDTIQIISLRNWHLDDVGGQEKGELEKQYLYVGV